MLSIIYSHRNRDLMRIERSLRSLHEQSVKDFEVYFVDYGSEKELADEISLLLTKFNFVKYRHYPTYHQPWNKSRALNSVIKHLETDFCFIADIDMIFHYDFVKTTLSLKEKKTAIYFQVGFLSASETKQDKLFQECEIDFESTNEATGLTMFPVKALKSINGFDEFYHFWGAEDTDVHVRLKNAGYEVHFFDQEILMLHQWHPSYRSKESKKLTKELRLTNAVKLNHQHLKYAVLSKTTVVNETGWGNPMKKNAYDNLSNTIEEPKVLSTQKEVIDHFLFHELPKAGYNIVSIVFKESVERTTFKYYLKKILGQSVPKFYTLKEVNDMLLTHIVSLYRDSEYFMKINVELNNIHFKIRKPK